MKVVCLFTCYNRKKLTERAIHQLEKNKVDIDFLVVDDNSQDGTFKMLKAMKKTNVTVLQGNGQLYYGGGMRKGMQYLLDNNLKYDYLLMINDDVDFFEHAIDKLIAFSRTHEDCITVGATKGDDGETTYCGIKYKSKISTKVIKIGPDQSNLLCDTFNGNCVLIPYQAFLKCGIFDEKLIHNFSEFDYGMRLKKMGFKIKCSNEHVGICNYNSRKNTWRDNTLPILKRIEKKESPKGVPFRIVFYYFKKHFNLYMALRCSISPYIRFILSR